MLNELAKNYQGLILQLARVCFRHMDPRDEEMRRFLKEEIRQITLTFLTNAFSIPKAKCEQILEEDSLLDWTVIDIQYWCAEKPEIVSDIKRKVIPDDLFSGMKGIEPSFSAMKTHTKEDGVYRNEADETPALGLPNSPFALTALDNLTAKMLHYGMVNLIDLTLAHTNSSRDSF